MLRLQVTRGPSKRTDMKKLIALFCLAVLFALVWVGWKFSLGCQQGEPYTSVVSA
jgi:hypothetical protein